MQKNIAVPVLKPSKSEIISSLKAISTHVFSTIEGLCMKPSGSVNSIANFSSERVSEQVID